METKKHKAICPIVLVNTKLGLLRIVNRNSTTSFVIRDHETKKEMDEENKRNGCDEWTPEHEVEMAVGNGFHRVHDTENDRWDLWDAGIKEQN